MGKVDSMQNPETTARTDLVVMVANQLGQHTKAIETLEATQRETNRYIKEIGLTMAGSVPRGECQKNRDACAAAIKNEIGRVGHVVNGGGWDKRSLIALLSLVLTFILAIGAATWKLGGEIESLRHRPIATVSAGVPTVMVGP